MNKLTIFLFAVLVLCLRCKARLFTRCGLVHELRKQGFPAEQLRNWVCLIEAESARNTRMVRASYNSRDWGLFQINDKYWCSTTNTPGKDCKVKCRDLVKDDITEAAKCAKIIHARYNFDHWFGWTKKCKNKTLPDITKCNNKQ